MLSGPILVTGASGQIGGAIVRLADEQGIEFWAPDRTQLNLAKESDIKEAVLRAPWKAVISCGAYTAVDRAEIEPELARKINTIAPAILACETARLGIPLIHVSTDYVFDGAKHAPYIEIDPVNPLGVYGQTKEAGEAEIRAIHSNYAIIRTAWVVSVSGANFINTMLRCGELQSQMSVVDDQHGCPSSADDIAAALIQVATNLGNTSGTWHFVNSGQATWYRLAEHVYKETMRRGLPTPSLIPITTAEFPTPAKRPFNSRLDTTKIQRDFNIKPRSWQEAVDAILAKRLYQA